MQFLLPSVAPPVVLRRIMSTAKKLAAKLREFRTEQGAEHFSELAQRAQQLETALLSRQEILDNPEPRIAFVAHKGVGKSTLINALAGLWLDEAPPPADATSRQLNQRAILPLGNGGTTPCEIRVEAGHWEVRVEREEVDQSRARLRQFAEWAWHKANDPKRQPVEPHPPSDQGNEEPPAGGRPPRLQPDIERVVRGIAGLPEHSVSSPTTGASGKKAVPPKHDRAEELAKGFPEKSAFVAEIEKLARLPERQRLQWLPTGDVRRWLRETLLNLIEGKFEDQPFPASITIRVPSTGVRWNDRDVPLIDTLGLPAVGSGDSGSRPLHPLAEREDLRLLLKSPWTVIVVGAQFNEPPAPSVELLQQMMDEAIFFGETLEDRTVLAIVDPGKAGAGNFADAETERNQKEDRCAENLASLGCPRGLGHVNRWSVDDARSRVRCVNILEGGCEPLQELLQKAVERMTSAHEARLSLAVKDAEDFFRSLGDAKRQAKRRAVVSAFKQHLSPVVQKQLGKARVFRSNLLKPFADECRALHPSTLRSVIVNRGQGRSQNAWAMLESATTRELNRILAPFTDQVDNTSKALLSDPWYQDDDGRSVIAEEADRRQRTVEAFLRIHVAAIVESARDHLLKDGNIWSACDNEWGRGIKDPGYKERVAKHFEQWAVDWSPALLPELNAAEDEAKADDSGMLRSLIEG
ncbi:hypothetical protein predicted by Glimmer/Critica [Sorangium cellulosum So ce56]|uniref:Uncharacterized protein n=1 Tax=Sorangium cellulosum (strain So ce56) TaxID=448385 RepID=A9F451_SORC5|nr:hypothetical protein [Sorangium cellulosum]CAN97675.1 hypothetical protein predicted by Glimmer/Critica [Sorangium cellulosum So ce56]